MQFPERTNLAAHEGISNHPFPFLSPEKLEGIEKYYEAHDAMPKTNAELYKTTDDIAGEQSFYMSRKCYSVQSHGLRPDHGVNRGHV